MWGAQPAWLLAFWTLSLILDEWNQWVVNPRTFEVDMWNKYDYVVLSFSALAWRRPTCPRLTVCKRCAATSMSLALGERSFANSSFRALLAGAS